MNVEEKFQDSIRFINNLVPNYLISFNERLKLYGLYKQSLFGNNTAPKPYFFNFKSLNKWTAWKKELGKSKFDAKTDYITYVDFIRSKIINN